MTGVNPATVVAGGPSFTITVTGSNFAQGDSVEWSNTPLTSTFVSSTQMTAQVPNTIIYETGSATIIVQPPTPYPISFGVTVSITAPPAPGSAGFTLSALNVQANDMVWDPLSQEIYLSLAGTDLTHPNTIAALNPVTGQFDTTVAAGPGADRLAVSSDSAWLYAGIDANGAVQRFALPGLASDISIPLGSDSLSRPNYAVDLEAAPGNPNTIAVAQAGNLDEAGEVVIYDGATPRAATVTNVAGNAHPLGSLTWDSSGSSLYAAFNEIYEDTVAILTVNGGGVQLAQTDNLNTGDEGNTLGSIHFSALTGCVYGDDGQVFDPSTGKVVNQLPLGAVGQGFVSAYNPLALDDNLGMAWVVGQPVGSQQYAIEAFDLKTFALLGSVFIPNVAGTPLKLIRWGSNGLAFLTTNSGAAQQGGGVYLISGNFVTNPSVQMDKTLVSHR